MIKVIFASAIVGLIGAFLGGLIVASVATVDTGERIMNVLFTGPSLSTFVGGFLTCSTLSYFYLTYVIKEETGFAARLFIAGIAGAVAGALAGLFAGFMNNLGAETLTLFFGGAVVGLIAGLLITILGNFIFDKFLKEIDVW